MESPDIGPPAAGETGNKLGVRFYRYRAVLKRYWWIVAICMTVALAYEAWTVFTKPTRYVSVGKLSVRETGSDEKRQMVIGDPSWYGTIKSTIESPAVKERVKTDIAQESPGREHLADGVNVSAANEVNTYFFAVTCVGPDPQYTTYFCDKIMAAFMKMRMEAMQADLESSKKSLGKQAEKEKAALDKAQKDLDDYIKQENYPNIDQTVQQTESALTELHRTVEDLQGQLNTTAHLDEPGILENHGTPAGSGAKRGGDGESRNDIWGQKMLELSDKETELKRRAEFWKPANPRYRQLVDDINKLKAAMNVLKEQASRTRESDMARLKAEIETKQARIKELDESDTALRKIQIETARLRNEVTTLREDYNKTREGLRKADSLDNSSSSEILEIQQKASAPVEESRGVLKGLITGVFGGLLLGLGILFVLDRADDRLASSSEMIEQFNEPILGQIPDVADSRTNEGLPLLQTEDDRYMYAEAFRSLRSSLIFMPNQTELKSLIITSAIPNEGKSTIASNLAITMANAGARVLLVDADLRRGDIAALFDIDGRQGLANILRGEVNWKDCVKSLRNDKLHIIPRGPVTNQSGELLLQPSLPKQLAEWKASYDLVIFNTAPILATDDTPTLAPNFDGTLMVIRASFTSARLTRNALNSLYQRQVNILGLILNCVDTEMPDYYYYRYPKYYAA